jgi:CDP-glycerol glycerophosphotransferase
MSAVPRLTIVLPCHRAEQYLNECLDSVLAYRGDELEVVAVDDASPDATGAMLETWAKRDARLRVVQLAENAGPGPARNVGVEHAAGDYIWYVDADDWLPPGSVEAVLDRLATHEPDLLVVDHAEVHGDLVLPVRTADRVGVLSPPVRVVDVPRILRLPPSPCIKIVRRSILDKAALRFPPGRYEDAFFSPAVLMAVDRVDVLDRVCYLYRQRPSGTTTTSTADWHFDVFDQYQRAFGRLDEAGDALEALRPELFRVMVDHYLVVLGHRTRLPRERRREFFRRVVRDFARYIPPSGYPRPAGLAGLKHSLVRLGWYPPYAVLRRAYRLGPRKSPVQRGR